MSGRGGPALPRSAKDYRPSTVTYNQWMRRDSNGGRDKKVEGESLNTLGWVSFGPKSSMSR